MLLYFSWSPSPVRPQSLSQAHSSEKSQILTVRRPPFNSSILIDIDRVVADVTDCHLWCFPIFHGLLQCDPPSDVHATPRPWCPQLRQTGNSTTLNASMAHTISPGRSGTPPQGTSSCRFDVLSLCSARDCRNQNLRDQVCLPTCWVRVAQPDITHKYRDSAQPTFDAS